MMWRHVHAARFIWNYMLDWQEKRYANGEKKFSSYDFSYRLTDLKKESEFGWLKDNLSSYTLQIVCNRLGATYKRFLEGKINRPKFKSRKKARFSFPISCGKGIIQFSETYVKIPTIKQIAYKTNYNVPLGKDQKFSNPAIAYTPNGKWILILGIECENQAPILTDKPMGIDLGVKELAVVAFGNEEKVFHNKNKSKKVRQKRRKLKHLQRNLARKQRMAGRGVETENMKKDKEKIRKLYYHITNIQHDYIHQTTHELVSLLPCKVTMEDLNVSGMMKNRHLSRSVAEQCFYEFIRQMEYKCAWNGIEFVKADRYYPSSKTCSCCGSYLKDLKLKDRTYNCPVCGLKIDRDYNAAINLMNYKVQSST